MKESLEHDESHGYWSVSLDDGDSSPSNLGCEKSCSFGRGRRERMIKKWKNDVKMKMKMKDDEKVGRLRWMNKHWKDELEMRWIGEYEGKRWKWSRVGLYLE